eukprot:TRINITY_DN7351_c0_g1_i1.p1 TRINITY_DN7351_c0_g1~~TRINITY_DN7351_c0_g1_i1.p1  ORF type:complete len:168 (-),score=0.65 TRINITY_DN7351_c0_g1_i1:298-801(-)
MFIWGQLSRRKGVSGVEKLIGKATSALQQQNSVSLASLFKPLHKTRAYTMEHPTNDIKKQKRTLETEKYEDQLKIWPEEGRHILAHYDEDTVVVYQAFKPNIAKYAVENQKFGGPNYSETRMTWIKTNFLWMMFRSGWGSKKRSRTNAGNLVEAVFFRMDFISSCRQ